ncbi:unnamed protein product [Paramecium primaurelia]|uniref:Transmembrane protein n=1 Tax=Paramecium primaurelia TaxID=5886 RepID=A0A8S1L9F3_PARPR|nr:unnamed protein product [Paramecium primaurelia]
MDLKQRKNLCNLTIQKSIIKKQIDSSNLSDQRQDQTQYTQRVQQIDVFEQQKYLEEQQLSQKSNILESDKNILYQIMLLIFLGITYEIIFELCVQLLQLMKPFIQHISSTLQFLSLFNIFILFKCFRSQKIKSFKQKERFVFKLFIYYTKRIQTR